MKIRIGTLGVALVVLTMAIRASAQSAAPALLVDVDWLSQHLNDRGLVVLHVEDKPEFEAGHVPGARFITMNDVAKAPGGSSDLTLELPPAEELRAKLSSVYGISDDSRIVVVTGSAAALQSATRIILTLDYLGLGDRTSLLNGGMTAWKRAGKPVTSTVAAVTPGKLSARPTKPLIVDAEFVKSVGQRANHRLVDARAAVFYTGIEATRGKSGHIPGALNIPFTEISNSERLIDRDRVEKLFRNAGIKPGETVVAYCHIGQQATAVIFGARLIGHPVLLYDGSFQDWAVNNRGPVEK